MDIKKLEQIQKTADAIRNFKECYTDCVLWGSCPDGDVQVEAILAWLIENPHMAKIAMDIEKLSK